MRMTAFLIVFVLWSGNVAWGGENADGIVNHYLGELRSPNVHHRIEAAKRITGEMLSEPRLYDEINRLLLRKYRKRARSPLQVDENAWLCKALASSGREDYRDTLQDVADRAPSRKLRHYARQSLWLIDDYAARNALVGRGEDDPELTPEENRYLRMIRSEQPAMQRYAAKRITRLESVHPKVFTAVHQALLLRLEDRDRRRLSVDTRAWLCRALGVSGNPEYRPTLEKIVASQNNTRVQMHARRALKYLN